MTDTTALDRIFTEAQALQVHVEQAQRELKKRTDALASVHYQGQLAMERITRDTSVPLLERLDVFFHAPSEFKMVLNRRPNGKGKAMQSAIDYAVEGRNPYDVIDLEDMARDAWRDYQENAEAVAWWAKSDGYQAKAFLEEMLQRSLLTFQCD